jgi:hypothetical protein
MPENPDESLLGHILGQGGITHDPNRQSEQSALVAAHESQTGLLIADGDP